MSWAQSIVVMLRTSMIWIDVDCIVWTDRCLYAALSTGQQPQVHWERTAHPLNRLSARPLSLTSGPCIFNKDTRPLMTASMAYIRELRQVESRLSTAMRHSNVMAVLIFFEKVVDM